MLAEKGRMLVCFVLLGAVYGQDTVIDVLQRYRATSLLNYLNAAGLTDTLKGTGPFTVFAPTNSAFSRLDQNSVAALQNDTTLLANTLKYHVVNGLYTHNDLVNEQRLTSLSGDDLRFNYYYTTKVFLIEGVRIYRADLKANNGIVHLMSGILVPPAGSVVDIVQADPELSTLLSVVQAAGLTNFLQDQNPITVFAPTNDAFTAAGNDTVQFLLQNVDILKKVLEYHVVPGTLYSAGYHNTDLHTFDEEDQIRLHKFLIFDYDVDNASFKRKDISATNGVIHKIDHVLIPNSVKSQLPTSPPPSA